MRLKFTIYCLFLVGALHAQNGVSVKNVVETFYSTYDLSDSSYPRVEFEKRKSDWYVKTISFDNGKAIRSKRIHFYNSLKKMFLELPFKKHGAPPSDLHYYDFMDEPEAINFDLQYYYGYPGWPKDVIAMLGTSKKLSEDELYALGRAYSARAMAPVTDQFGDQVEAEAFKMPFHVNAFTPAQKKQFLQFQDSAISKFRQLSLRNPGFSTRVGDIRDKYANEVMVRFHILLTFANDVSKLEKLPVDLYKEETLNSARAFLSKLPERAIFLSYGDNDFYPVLYLQHARKFRDDVHVINYNIMALDRYIFRSTKPQFAAPGIKIAADTNLYVGLRNTAVYIHDSPDVVLFPDFIRLLRSKAKSAELYPTLTAKALRIRLHWGDGERQTADVTLNGNGYLYKNQWIILDILNNLEGRKFCMLNQFPDELNTINQYFREIDGYWQYDN